MYRLYGLTVEAPFIFPELILAPADSVIDVRLRTGTIPLENTKNCIRGARYQGVPRAMQLRLDDVGRFSVKNGTEITIELEAASADAALRCAVLSSPLGALLLQRGLISLHSSAIATPQGAILFLGPSGVGKSTLAAWFRTRGFLLLADDISVIRHEWNGSPSVLPGYPLIKLYQDALTELGIGTPELERVRPGAGKFALPCRGEFKSAPLPLAKIYLLASHNEPQVLFEDLYGNRKTRTLLNQTYRRNFVIAMDIIGAYERLVRLATANIPVSVVLHRPGLENLTMLGDAILSDISELKI